MVRVEGSDNVQLYFEHAEEYGPLLNLKVAQKRTTAGPVAMACHSDWSGSQG